MKRNLEMKYLIVSFALVGVVICFNISKDFVNKKDEFIPRPCKNDQDCGDRSRCSLYKHCYRLNCSQQTDCFKVYFRLCFKY